MPPLPRRLSDPPEKKKRKKKKLVNSAANAAAKSREAQEARKLQQAVIDRIGNPKWDLLLVGDGSGSGWDGCAGWSTVLVTNEAAQQRRVFYGACNSGSVNLAETMPYLQAMTWYDTHYGRDRLKQLTQLHVHVLSDSQTIVNWGNKAVASPDTVPRKMLALWAGVQALSQLGYMFRFHWAPRQTTELNWAADLIAGLARGTVKDINDRVIPSATSVATALASLSLTDPVTGKCLLAKVDPYSVNPK